MTAEKLLCRCGVEVKIVRLNRELLALGHVRNLAQNHHAVRLSRAAAVSTTREEVDVPQRQPRPVGRTNSRPVRARRVDRVVIPPDRPSASRPERLGLRSTPGEQA